MSDSLQRAVDAYDRAHNDPKVLRRLARTTGELRRICLTCRAPVPPTWTLTEQDEVMLTEPARCPSCGGALVDVEH